MKKKNEKKKITFPGVQPFTKAGYLYQITDSWRKIIRANLLFHLTLRW